MTTVRTVLVLTLLLCSAAGVHAQIPRHISYQGVLTDSSGIPKPDGLYTFSFSLFDVLSGGSPLWTEPQQLQVSNGLFSTYLGGVIAFPASVTFDRTYWLGITVVNIGELAPRIRLIPAAYSLGAVRADTARGVVTGGVGSAAILNGSIQLVDLAQNGATPGQVLKWNGSAWTVADDNAGSDVWATNGSAISYTGGNVGVGDASPAATFTIGNGDKVQIDGNQGDVFFSDDQATITFAGTALPNSPMIHMFGTGTANADRMVIAHSGLFPTWGLEYHDTSDVFYMRTATGRKFAFELASGDLGIGVENPEFPLDLVGRMRLQGDGNLNNSPGIWFRNVGNTADRAFMGMTSPDSIFGLYSDGFGWGYQFAVLGEPRLSIGAGAPQTELHVQHGSASGLTEGFRLENVGTNGEDWTFYVTNSDGALELYRNGLFRGEFNGTSGAYTSVSDARLKEQIADHKDVLGDVLRVRLKTYRYRDTQTRGDHSGFLAQELEQIFPQFVMRGGDNHDLYTVDYAGLSGIALKAIQEQQAMIDAQKSRIDDLAREVQELKDLIRNPR
jgi:hypothetical protein